MVKPSPGSDRPAQAGSCTAQCSLYPYRDTLCRSHPDCLMLAVKQLEAPPREPAAEEHQVSESVVRSLEGGHCRTRSVRDVSGRALVEDVELHCRTLTLEVLMTPESVDPDEVNRPPR